MNKITDAERMEQLQKEEDNLQDMIDEMKNQLVHIHKESGKRPDASHDFYHHLGFLKGLQASCITQRAAFLQSSTK